MEGEENEPHLTGLTTNQEGDSSKKTFHPGIPPMSTDSPPPAPQAAPSPYDQMPLAGHKPTHTKEESGELNVGTILPSMPSPDRHSPDLLLERPAPQAAPSHFDQMSQAGYEPTHPKMAGRILPSMLSQQTYSPDSSPERPAPQAASTPYDYIMPPGFGQTQDCDAQVPATYAKAEPRGPRAGRNLPSVPIQGRNTSYSPPPVAYPSHSPHMEQIGCDQAPASGYELPQATDPQAEPREIGARRVIPSVTSQMGDSLDSPSESPTHQSTHSPYDHMPPGFQQTAGYALPVATHQTEPVEPSTRGILPSMPLQRNGTPDLSTEPKPEPPLPQAAPSQYTPMPQGFGVRETPGYSQELLSTYPRTEPGGLGAGSTIPPSFHSLGYPSYSAGATETGAYSSFGPPTMGIPPAQSYHRYAPYQATYGYPHGTGASAPYPSHVARGSQAEYAAAGAGGSYAGLGAGQMYGSTPQAYPPYGSAYSHPQQYTPDPYNYHGLPSRGQTRYQGRSYATRPGRPYIKDKNKGRTGPDGANLFVFYIPNDMTNEDMRGLFQQHGNVLSAKIMTEQGTGRGKGYGFVSYDSAESAASAIHHLNGYQIRGKRLLVQHKQTKENEMHNRRNSSPASSIQMQEYRRHSAGQSPLGFVPVREPAPLQEYAAQPEPHRHGLTPLLPPVDDELQHPRALTPTLPPMDGHHQSREPTPTLPPIEGLDEGSEQGAQGYITPPSSLANMQDIGKSLPDHE